MLTNPQVCIFFAQLAHNSDDDRAYYHQYDTLLQLHEVDKHIRKIRIPNFGISQDKIEALNESLRIEREYNGDIPYIFICDTPIAVISTRKVFPQPHKIIYDVTEWYPSKKNMRNCLPILRPLKWAILNYLHKKACSETDAFIFGEEYKAEPILKSHPNKEHIFLPYYPSTKYICPKKPNSIKDCCKLFYAGPLTDEKGYSRILAVAQKVAAIRPKLHFTLTIITNSDFKHPTEQPSHNLDIIYKPFLPFCDFCKEITKHDIFLDLRDIDKENTLCLPIKLFYYIAAGRPVIYSDLKAIRKHLTLYPNIDNILVQPNDIEKICDIITQYIDAPEYYENTCKLHRSLFQDHYNWEAIKNDFLILIDKVATQAQEEFIELFQKS